MAREQVLRLEVCEGRPRRPQPEHGVDTERLALGTHVADRAEGVRDEQDAPLRPPERDLAPEAAPEDAAEFEGSIRNAAEGRLVDGDAQLLGEGVRVAPVPVEQDEDTRGLAERPDPLLDALSGNRIDEPDAAAGRERVRRARHGTAALVDPAEAEVRLVAEADGSFCAQANTSRTLRRPAASRSISSGTV